MHTPPSEITSREAAELLGVAEISTVMRYVRLGKLVPARKLPGRTGAYLFRRRDVEKLAQHRLADLRKQADRIEQATTKAAS